jgi:hypothetical protein
MSGTVIVIADADKHVSKEEALDITKEQFEQLQSSVKLWRQWRKSTIQQNQKRNPNLKTKSRQWDQIQGPVLFARDQKFYIRTNRWVGTISSPQIVLQLQPKFPVKAALNIICSNALRNSSMEFNLPPQLDFLSQVGEDEMGFSVAYLFVSFVDSVFQSGARASYYTVQEKLHKPKGRILIATQMRKQQGILFPVHCSYQVHSYDNLENRLIKSGLKQLLYVIQSHSMQSYSPELISRLEYKIREHISKFDDIQVSDTTFDPRRLPKINYNQQNAYYQPACSLAGLILSQSSSSLQGDRSSGSLVLGSCWLYNMANEFEQYVRDSLRVSECLRGIAKGQVNWSLGDDVRMEPDLVLNNCVLIGDVKYRTYSPAKRRSDLFQILAYASTSIATLQDTVLVYAAVDKNFVDQSKKLQTFKTCEDLSEYLLLQDIRENVLLRCMQCTFLVDLLCSWDYEKRIWCCCLNLPESSHSMLAAQLAHVISLLEKHLPDLTL